MTSAERATPWMMLVSVRYAGANCESKRAPTDADVGLSAMSRLHCYFAYYLAPSAATAEAYGSIRKHMQEYTQARQRHLYDQRYETASQGVLVDQPNEAGNLE